MNVNSSKRMPSQRASYQFDFIYQCFIKQQREPNIRGTLVWPVATAGPRTLCQHVGSRSGEIFRKPVTSPRQPPFVPAGCRLSQSAACPDLISGLQVGRHWRLARRDNRRLLKDVHVNMTVISTIVPRTQARHSGCVVNEPTWIR